MRIGIVKPDFGIRGGFEILTGHIVRELQARGHDVVWRRVHVPGVGNMPFGLEIPEPVRLRTWEAFRYLSTLEAFLNIETEGLDLVISTQPPSFAVDHPRQLSIFYHHLRVFYDLSDVYVASGFTNPHDHELALRAVRTVDATYLERPRHFLAGSDEVRGRLARFHQLNVGASLLHAPSPHEDDEPVVAPECDGHVLCVSRHEFPKRTELVVHAMKYLERRQAVLVGAGGRLPFVVDLDARLSAPDVDLDAFTPTDLWLNRGEEPAPSQLPSNVHMRPHVLDGELVALYRKALCVVAPAYLEDYGLTALEAMSFGRPVIVCNDGGGLTELVEDGVTGFVVAPTGRAIADAIRRFVDDPALAAKLGANGRERARTFTWSRAMSEVEDALDRVMA